MNYAIFLNIKNTKSDYIICSKFIEDISNSNNLTYSKVWNYAKDLKIELKKPINKNLPFAKLEEPLLGYDISSSVESVGDELWIDNANEFFENIHFHIRIDFYEQPDMQYLHYLALLITNHESLVLEKRISIFLIPRTGSKYPYTFENSFDEVIFNEASLKLRALIGDGNYGIIYGASHKKTSLHDTIVKSLNYKTIERTKNIFPTIIFNGNLSADKKIFDYYKKNKVGKNRINKPDNKIVDNYLLLFHKSNTIIDYFQQALNMTDKNRFGYADCYSPLWAMCDYLFESSYLLFKSKCEYIGYDLIKNKQELERIFDNSNIICFAIFSYILHIDIKFENYQKVNDQMKKCFHMAYEITESLDQIVQNALQHSEKKKCVMSINRSESKLNIIISDLNKKHILESFERDLNNERLYLESEFTSGLFQSFGTESYRKIISDTSNLLNRFDPSKLEFRYFFNDFNNSDGKDEKENWMNFRRSDSSAHIGLAIFANTMKKCGGVFRVASSSKYGEKSDVFYSNTGETIHENDVNFCGTEYQINIPTFFEISLSEQNSLTKFVNTGFNENYNSYAKFLKYEPEYIDFNSSSFIDLAKKYINSLETGINQYSNKFQMLIIFTNYWLSCFNLIKKFDNKVYVIDANNVFNETYILESDFITESFVKGFFNALSVYVSSISESYELMLSIINLNSKVFQMILRISSALSIKEFPNNVQLFIIEKDYHNQVQLFGINYAEAIQNAYILALEFGCSNYSGDDYYNSNKLIEPFNEFYKNHNNHIKRDLFPFSSIIRINERSNIFFELVNINSEEELSSSNVGYKISNCHMRLGNKVHIDSFYEMSYLFYRTIMANQVAFYIIKDLIKNNSIDIYNDRIMFYGYASYSQAILMSLVQILKALRSSNKLEPSKNNEIYYSIYQYNLQYESDSENISVYTNDEKEVNAIENELKVIQIVPISTTMTTFSKMWSKLYAKYKSIELIENYTIFWVRDRLLDKNENETDLEKKYYKILNDGSIKTDYNALKSHNEIKYIIEKSSTWSVPEKCEKCFPPNNLLEEVPLIETDQTSTVPSQQLVYEDKLKYPEWNFETQKRVASLLGHIHYGHFRRGKNHHQFFIDTQSYFNCVSKDVKIWLKDIKTREKEEKVDYPYINIIFSPVHNTNVGFSQYVNSYYFDGTAEIITINEDKEYRSNFKCEHSEIIRNIEKMYYDYISSNRETNDYRPVRFTFVDDNIVTGLTFKKANSFMQELLPKELVNKYTTNVFNKCFVLVNRLSSKSINSYILPNDNFYAYCSLNISNTRIQGDSCVCCKINSTATRLFKKSSTYYSAKYWYNKSKKLNEVNFDSIISCPEEIKFSYLNAVLSHIIKNYLTAFNNTDDDIYSCILSLFDFYTNNKKTTQKRKVLNGKYAIKEKYLYESFSLIDIKELKELSENQIIENNNNPNAYKIYFEECYYNEYVNDLTKNDVIKSLITVVTRPYFTYNQVFRKAITRFLISFCEYVFGNIMNLDNSSIAVAEHLSNLFTKKELVLFLKEYVFEALSNLNSTYMLRKQTIEKLLKYLNKATQEKIITYYEQKYVLLKYSIYIQRIVDNGSDETRSLWFEHMLLTGNESYNDSPYFKKTKKTFSETILNNTKVSSETEDNFKIFCCELFFLNGKLLYDGIKHLLKKDGSDKPSEMLEEYFLKRVNRMRNIDLKYIGIDYNNNSSLIQYNKSEIELYKLLSVPKTKKSINDKYNSLINSIKSMICEKYGIKTDSDYINIALLTCQSKNPSVDVHDLEIFGCALDEKLREGNTEIKIANSKYIIKKRIVKALKTDFREKGYFINNSSMNCSSDEYIQDQKNSFLNDDFDTIENSNHKNPYFIIQFNNNYKKTKDDKTDYEINHKEIVPIYLYISIICEDVKMRKTLPYFIIRDIMSYQYDLLNYFIEDFTTDVMQNYASSIDKDAILENEKVMSHTAMSKDQEEMDYVIDNEEQIRNQYPLFFIDKDSQNSIDAIRILHSFVISRNYCNATIARLFNRVFRNLNKKIEEIIVNNHTHKIKDTAMLYMENNYISERNIPLININEIIPTDSTNDKMFVLFKEIIQFDIQININTNGLKAVSYKVDNKNYSYNLDFVKNIIYRICFDAMRFSYGCKGETDDFSARVLNHLYEKVKREIKDKSEFVESSLSKEPICFVSFSIESEANSNNFDWLIIRNLISPSYINTTGFIKKKLEDPLDFADGHMSLVAAKEYFSLLMDPNDKELLLDMYSYEEKDGKKFFITKLPIIKKE